ncbi:hypothetical protein OG705_29895 [Streptomyces sp. NBC_00838]|uniref:hypothetical protein n=1 Tax=Streptomyces sp. NBC_00838 TaxID=2903680 RepID=UPI003862DD15|nr:hypothetical protein OG705_29895 [Streptomyces sp. NBC_00838]
MPVRDASLDGFPSRLVLYRAKSHFPPPHADYHHVLTPAVRAAVEDAFADEFRHHSYPW